MQFSLTPELERLVQQRVDSGLYRDVNEVIYDALRRLLLQEHEEWTHEALKHELALGAEEAERGEFSPDTMDGIIARMEKNHSGGL